MECGGHVDPLPLRRQGLAPVAGHGRDGVRDLDGSSAEAKIHENPHQTKTSPGIGLSKDETHTGREPSVTAAR